MAGLIRPTGTVRRTVRLTALAAFAIGCASVTAVSSQATPSQAIAAPKSEGLLCTKSSSTTPGAATFVLTATTGIINLPDGNSMLMWGYANGNGAFQYPGPVLCANEGDQVTVTLRNQLAVRTSLMFLGIDGVTVNSQPAQAQFSGSGELRSLTNDVATSGSITYRFTAGHPGTYLYQSGNDPELQVEMGLVGALIVYPPAPTAGELAAMTDVPVAERANVRFAYDDRSTMSRYTSEHEYLVLLTELDPELHYAVEEGGVLTSAGYTAEYKPRYFMINGRSFPDTVAPNNAGWLPSQPYGALAHVEPKDAANPLPSLLRYLAVGGEPYPFHPHSNHEDVIAKDGRLLTDQGFDLSLEKFAIIVDPGTTIDALFTWENVEDYDAVGNPAPVPVPNAPNLTEGEYWSGSPYLGSSGALNPEVQAKNVCGEYYHVAHNHNLAEATNYGAAFGGQLTLIRVDPANTATCGNA